MAIRRVLNRVVADLMNMQERQFQSNSFLTAIEKEMRQTESAIQNIITAIESGVITNSTTRRLKELEKQIHIERSKIAVKLSKKDIREYYEQALKLEPQCL